ncbi:MAG: response regulator [Moraxellaceae bacterium]|nr:MAG: response regulator [Moraxellaceae bacterium]
MAEVINVLIVEDDDVDVEVLTRMFKKLAIPNPVYRASNGVQALEIMRGKNAEQKITQPFIILLDINMPLMNGAELLQEMRADNDLKDNVVFILTTSPRQEDIQMAYDFHAAGYFLKRDSKELVNLINMYMQLNQFPLVKKSS